jgi:beta-barrel assembly-enhancing protease
MLPRRPHNTKSQSGFAKGRLLIALLIAVFAFGQYWFSAEENVVTGTTQRIAMTKGEEIALGLQSAPTIAQEYGGLHGDAQARHHVAETGERLAALPAIAQTDYRFDFHLLRDPETVNAFALPGGQIFITYGLYRRLNNDDQLAGVLAHEIGHVVARHGAQQLAKEKLSQGLTTAAVIGTGDHRTAQMAQMIGRVVTMKYGRGDELESDRLGVRFMREAGYNPHALIDVMKILKAAGGGGNTPEFFSTHPNPENRIERIKEAIAEGA